MGSIKNREALLSAGDVELRRLALDIAEAAIVSADPATALCRYLRLDGETLRVGDLAIDLSRNRRIFVIGAGKASYPIAKALDTLLGARISKGLVACKYGQGGSLEFIEMRFAGHPIPDAASLEASVRTTQLLEDVRCNDVVFACFTGGSSSLFVDPVGGVSLEDKAATNQILLTCGASIFEINAVRKHLSKVKGGKLVRRLPPGTHLINLTVSDVIGDHLDYVTDPSVPDTSTFADANATLDRYELWTRLPASVTSYLHRAPPLEETVRAEELAHVRRTDILLLKSDAACEGARDAARRRGLHPLLLSTFFEGESSTLGRSFAAIAKQVLASGDPISAPCILIGGGETSVTVNRPAGQGGPNQEFVAAAALALAGTRGVVVLGMDTDGTDGPTVYAGGIADGTTLDIARRAGIDLYTALRSHNVTPALESIGHLLVTGATGTNVNDLRLLLIAP